MRSKRDRIRSEKERDRERHRARNLVNVRMSKRRSDKANQTSIGQTNMQTKFKCMNRQLELYIRVERTKHLFKNFTTHFL